MRLVFSQTIADCCSPFGRHLRSDSHTSGPHRPTLTTISYLFLISSHQFVAHLYAHCSLDYGLLYPIWSGVYRVAIMSLLHPCTVSGIRELRAVHSFTLPLISCSLLAFLFRRRSRFSLLSL